MIDFHVHSTASDGTVSPDELAELAQTIPYEIMLGFGARIPVEVVD